MHVREERDFSQWSPLTQTNGSCAAKSSIADPGENKRRYVTCPYVQYVRHEQAASRATRTVLPKKISEAMMLCREVQPIWFDVRKRIRLPDSE